MKKEEIYQLLNERGFNATMIARSMGLTAGAVQRVIIEGYGSERIATAIADLCEIPMFEMFPYYQKKYEEKIARDKAQKQLNKQLQKLA